MCRCMLIVCIYIYVYRYIDARCIYVHMYQDTLNSHKSVYVYIGKDILYTCTLYVYMYTCIYVYMYICTKV